MCFYFPLNSEQGHKYVIELKEQSLDFAEISLQDDVKVYNITLVLSEPIDEVNNPATLFKIGHILLEFLNEHNCILYFYCSPNDDTLTNKKREISPQEYRSRIFTTIFDRVSKEVIDKKYLHMRYRLAAGDDTFFNHFIADYKFSNIIEELELKFSELDKVDA